MSATSSTFDLLDHVVRSYQSHHPAPPPPPTSYPASIHPQTPPDPPTHPTRLPLLPPVVRESAPTSTAAPTNKTSPAPPVRASTPAPWIPQLLSADSPRTRVAQLLFPVDTR